MTKITTKKSESQLLVVLAVAILGTFGCSWSILEPAGNSCPKPQITFAGVDHPFLCLGKETTIRVDVSRGGVSVEDASLQYLVSSEKGVIRVVDDSADADEGLWTYVNEQDTGDTRIHVFVENTCGVTSETFVVHDVACEPSDSDSDTVPQIEYDGPRHVILFIGDGMGQNSEVGASRYLHGEDHALRFHFFPYTNQVTTWDINTYNLYSYNVNGTLYEPDNASPYMGYNPDLGGTELTRGVESVEDYFLVPQLNWPDPSNTASARIPATDSAAAATAMATGQKTDRYNLSWLPGDPPDGQMKTVAEYARELGQMAIGVVSTVPFSHATPAAFVAHNTTRTNKSAIAHEILFEERPDVVIGGGHPIFYNSFSYISEEDWDALQTTEDWQFVQRQAGVDGGEQLLAAADAAVTSGKPLLGIFGLESFENPIPQDAPGSPSFVHPTNENPSLAEATEAALNVLSSNENGFFLMVEGGAIDFANHKKDFARMVGCMWDFDRAVAQAINWINQEGDDVTMENTLILVTADHANGYISYDENNPLGVGDLPTMVQDGGWQYPDGDVDYGISGHTNELVHLYAAGAGIYNGPEAFVSPFEGQQYDGLPILDNTQIYQIAMAFLGLSAE